MSPKLIPWDGIYDDERDPMRYVGMYMSYEMVDVLDAWARKHHCSRSEAIRTFVTKGMQTNAQTTRNPSLAIIQDGKP